MHIVSNLLSNAIKFSPEGKDVYVHALVEPRPAGQVFTIKIKDTGIGIPKEKLSFIFDQFYQADNSSTRRGEGTGIGLTLVKELVHLMAGRIDVKSELGQGSEFRVILPVKRDYPIKKEGHKKPVPALSASRTEASSLDLQQNGDKPLMLIVEDNPDLVKYLVTFFNPIYHLEVAYNGQQGIEKAISLVPDIIITDVMMPQKDGFELCMAVKQHDMTSHIPIIMLTAKVDVASRLAGLKRGADAYLAKPFLPEELNIWITALLNQRRRLQAYYRSHLGLPKKYQFEVPDTEDTSKENTFLENVNCIIIEKLDNPNLNVEVLSADLFISVSNLYRKLKALTGLSPNQYIRSLRLARAKRLLKKPAYTIADVAYETGFSDPDYFTRVFKKEFGQTPSEFRHPIKA